MRNHLNTEYQNKLPSPHLPSPCIHINVRNEIIWSKKFKIVWKQNTRKKFPFPCYRPHTLIPHSHSHATVPMLPWGWYCALASVPMIWTQSSHPHAPISKLPNRHFTISMLPCKSIRFSLTFFPHVFIPNLSSHTPIPTLPSPCSHLHNSKLIHKINPLKWNLTVITAPA